MWGSFYDKTSQGGFESEFDLKRLLYKISLTSPVWYIILGGGGAGGELTVGIVRIQNRVIRPTAAVSTEHPADSYLENWIFSPWFHCV